MNILVVDDEKDVQMLFEQRFRREIKDRKVAFAFANSGKEALNYLYQHQHEAPLVLSDINMPGMSGLELLQHIRREFDAPPPRVMMITAYGDIENYQQAIRLGADDFFTKPLDFKLLKEKLQIANEGSTLCPSA
ncbi:MAG: response regulator [Chitinophagaceae bacterium]|nr:response regulator [Chitinophagaceae bacterium]